MKKVLLISKMKPVVFRKKIRLSLILFLLISFSLNSLKAQDANFVATGRVVNQQNSPQSGVTVVEENNETNGSITNDNGEFQLSVSGSDANLIFSSVGFQTQTIRAGKLLNVILVPSSTAIDSLVVIGYGTTKKVDLTGSVGSVKGTEVLDQPIQNALQGLQGKIPGVDISLNSGAPGGVPSIIIRGISSISSSTEPLYIVDGVATSNINYLNPYDIESIDVLKDASSTSIYGSRGSNGVVLITTKRGAKEEGTIVSYDFSISRGRLAKELKTLNSEEYLRVIQGAVLNNPIWGAPVREIPTNSPMLFDSNGKPLYNTDWQREGTRTAISNHHQLAIQNKGKKSSTGVFFGYNDDQGIILGNKLNTYSVKIANDTKIKKWLDAGFNLLYNYSVDDIVPPTTGNTNPPRGFIEMPPIFPVKFPDGTWANSSTVPDGWGFLDAIPNPVRVLKELTQKNTTGEVFGNAYLNFHISEYLQFKSQFGIDFIDTRGDFYSPTDLFNNSANQKGVASLNNLNSQYWQQENFLTYDKDFGVHHLNVMGGISWQKKVDKSFGASSQTFSNDHARQWNLGSGSNPQVPSSDFVKWSMNSYFARIGYNYKQKYLATFSGRADGSSRFGSNQKYAFFPSLGLGYVLSEEAFLKDSKVIDFLKLRASYGVTGNTEIGSYQSLAMLGSGTVLINGSRAGFSEPNNVGNDKLKWEKSKQLDLGFELNMFANRIRLEADFYHKLTDDLLLNRPIPASTGFSSILSNIGSVENNGVEIGLNLDVLPNKGNNFRWNSSIIASFNKNKVKALGVNNEDIFPGPFWGPVSNGFTILRVGEPIGSFYGFERLGTYSTEEVQAALEADPNFPFKPGEEKESEDKKILGHSQPNWSGSFVNTFKYRNFSLMVDLQFSQGASYVMAFLFSGEDRVGWSGSLRSVLDQWTPEHQNTMIQRWRMGPDAGQSASFDSHWVADASFLRGRNIQLSYDFNKGFLSGLKLKELQLFLSAQNAFLITSRSFKGYDPQGMTFDWNAKGVPPFAQNIDFYSYPKARTFTFGLHVSF